MDNRNNTNDIIVTATDTTSVEDTTTATAVKQRGGKVKGFFSALNSKRKKLMLSLTTALTMAMMSSVSAFAAPAPGAGGGIGGDAGEAQFNAVISFFAVWIGRIGLVVGFIGAVMFALAIKNDDADAKTRGLMTMASGFVVFAVTQALSLFGITA